MMASGSGVIIDPEKGTFLYYRDRAVMDLHRNGRFEMRAIVSDSNTLPICWVFGIAEELMRRWNGRIIQCDVGVYATGSREVRLALDKSEDSVMLPFVTPAEHFSVIVDPLASGQSYDSYLQECKEGFHSHKVFGITGMASHNETKGNGIDYCIRIADELKRNENAKLLVSSGWVCGPGQYALDIVLIHDDSSWTDLVPGELPKSNSKSMCSGWLCGLGQYALDIFLMHDDTAWTDGVPGETPKSNSWSKCKLQRAKPNPRWLE